MFSIWDRIENQYPLQLNLQDNEDTFYIFNNPLQSCVTTLPNLSDEDVLPCLISNLLYFLSNLLGELLSTLSYSKKMAKEKLLTTWTLNLTHFQNMCNITDFYLEYIIL